MSETVLSLLHFSPCSLSQCFFFFWFRCFSTSMTTTATVIHYSHACCGYSLSDSLVFHAETLEQRELLEHCCTLRSLQSRNLVWSSCGILTAGAKRTNGKQLHYTNNLSSNKGDDIPWQVNCVLIVLWCISNKWTNFLLLSAHSACNPIRRECQRAANRAFITQCCWRLVWDKQNRREFRTTIANFVVYQSRAADDDQSAFNFNLHHFHCCFICISPFRHGCISSSICDIWSSKRKAISVSYFSGRFY